VAEQAGYGKAGSKESRKSTGCELGGGGKINYSRKEGDKIGITEKKKIKELEAKNILGIELGERYSNLTKQKAGRKMGVKQKQRGGEKLWKNTHL